MEIYSEIAKRIIKQQENIIGPVAVEQAEQVPNLKVDWEKHEVAVSGDGAKVIDALVEQYKQLFGNISVEVCKEAAGPLISKLPEGHLPKTLA
jgi:nitric oxide reductase large subunit